MTMSIIHFWLWRGHCLTEGHLSHLELGLHASKKKKKSLLTAASACLQKHMQNKGAYKAEAAESVISVNMDFS